MSIPPVIIIAEPDPIFGNMLRVEFSQAGFAVLMASTGPEAEAYARQTTAHLVLLDAALPGPTSYYACAQIRRFREYEGTPIVVTAREHHWRVEKAAQRAGATLLLVKPYAFRELLCALERHIAPEHPLRVTRPAAPHLGETSVEWGPLPPLNSRVSPDSVLSQNARVLPIVRGGGVRIPVNRKP